MTPANDSAARAAYELYLEALRENDALQSRVAELEGENAKLRRTMEIKDAHSLANNLCPDHRDKQIGKPCLACEVETLQRKLRTSQGR